MISRETENVHSSKDVEDAFKALTEGADKDVVTEQELYQVFMIPGGKRQNLVGMSLIAVETLPYWWLAILSLGFVRQKYGGHFGGKHAPNTIAASDILLRGVSTNKTIICFIAMQTYKELMIFFC
jgi:hypothetical protein